MKNKKIKNAVKKSSHYSEFYEELAKKYPETEIVHENRDLGSRYWSVMNELRPFAKMKKKLLDVGCNDGVYTLPYRKMGGQALGIDISPTIIRKAQMKAKQTGLNCRFIKADIESEKIRRVINENFDVALFSEVLEHVRNPEQTLKNIHKLLKPKGYLVLTTPTPLFEKISHMSISYICRVLRGKKLLERQIVNTSESLLKDYGVSLYMYRHDGYYPNALRRYVESKGFKCVKFYTIGFFFGTAKKLSAKLMWAKHLSGIKKRKQNKKPLHNILKYTYYCSDFMLRKIPLINLFGVTNMGVFRKI